MKPFYEVRNLVIDLYTANGVVRPVDDVSFSVGKGECLAIVGESGSGKTVMNMAPLGLMPAGVAVETRGSVRLGDDEITAMTEADLVRLRGRTVGAIFQDPMTALNPARRIGRQIAEVCERSLGMTRAQARTRTLDLMQLVGISDAPARLRQYPHELSGGLCQRVMIAMAVAAEPAMLIADEPTTALDVTVQAQILAVLRDLQVRLDMALILITHDIGVVAAAADTVAVMYAGRLAEYGSVGDVLVTPRHPCSQGLIASIPQPGDPVGAQFRGLAGRPPELGAPIRGCAFAPRCPHAFAPCPTIRPPMRDGAACHLLTEGA